MRTWKLLSVAGVCCWLPVAAYASCSEADLKFASAGVNEWAEFSGKPSKAVFISRDETGDVSLKQTYELDEIGRVVRYDGELLQSYASHWRYFYPNSTARYPSKVEVSQGETLNRVIELERNECGRVTKTTTTSFTSDPPKKTVVVAPDLIRLGPTLHVLMDEDGYSLYENGSIVLFKSNTPRMTDVSRDASKIQFVQVDSETSYYERWEENGTEILSVRKQYGDGLPFEDERVEETRSNDTKTLRQFRKNWKYLSITSINEFGDPTSRSTQTITAGGGSPPVRAYDTWEYTYR